MMNKFLTTLFVLALIGLAIFWTLTRSNADFEAAAKLPKGDAVAGEQVFWAGGCTSCHTAPKAKGDAKRILAGGVELKTPFGTFRAPNISPDDVAGLGLWSLADFANAMRLGVSPKGEHYYPAFPYTSYARMNDKDVSDLWAFMKTLPKSDNQVADHDVGFPFNIRRGLGLWKWLYLNPEPVLPMQTDPGLARGQYLVESITHCGECHTPRNAIGGPNNDRWLAGGVSPEGKERIPNITPHKDGVGGWSVDDIVNSLETGFTPEFDSFGSSMADVQENMAKLPISDLQAIAAYLKSVPPVEKEK